MTDPEVVFGDYVLTASDTFNPSQTIFLRNNAGKEAVIDFSGDTVTFSGDLPVDEAARIFFEHVGGWLKAHAGTTKPPVSEREHCERCGIKLDGEAALIEKTDEVLCHSCADKITEAGMTDERGEELAIGIEANLLLGDESGPVLVVWKQSRRLNDRQRYYLAETIANEIGYSLIADDIDTPIHGGGWLKRTA